MQGVVLMDLVRGWRRRPVKEVVGMKEYMAVRGGERRGGEGGKVLLG